jgi:microsomal dipeptidase-like Zn-dependent dipeptidase
MAKKILKFIAVLIVLAAIAFFYFVPEYIDKSKNTVTAKQATIHKSSWYDSIPFIADLHCDALLWNRNFLKEHNYGHVDLPRMQKANMALQVFTIVSKTPRGMNIEENSDRTDNIGLLSFAQMRPVSSWFDITKRALNQCNDLHRFAEKSNNEFRVVTSQKELQQFITDRQLNKKLTAGMLGLEGAHCLNNDLNNLQKFYDAGVRYIGLAHFFDNEWAGSAHGMKKEGITDAGKQLIKKMDSLHIIIDLAHSSPKTIDDIFHLTNGPLLVSHTGVQGMCNNRRNLTDAQILEIGNRNGLIGIGLWETAVCGTNAEATAKSIKYLAEKIGVDKVALGSDFDGAIQAHFDVTGLPLIVSALEKEGFTRPQIEMIMGGNIRDFFLRNLPVN